MPLNSGAWGRYLPLLLCLVVGACATARPARSLGVGRTPPSSPLANHLTELLETPEAKPALWALFVRSLDNGEILHQHNGDRLLMPASAMKLATLAVAAEQLGWDYRYETHLLSDAPVVDGVLRGDLIVRGSGDPTISSATNDDESVFDAWTQSLIGAGITAIDGRIIGDDDLVEDAALGYGWSWDDLAYGYATPTGALQYHDNVVLLTVHPGSVFGEETLIEVLPRASGIRVVNRVDTVLVDAEPSLRLRRLPDGALEVLGEIPSSSSPTFRTASVNNPTIFFVRDLRRAFLSGGITVSGDAVDRDDIDDTIVERDLRILASRQSPPLSALAAPLMQVSQNLYAETLLNTLDPHRRPRTAEAGREVMRNVLQSWGVNQSQIVVADGSGLSRYNYVTARALVDILQRMHDDPRHTAPYRNTLPVAGVSGSLTSRLNGTAAEGNVQAKTGSMTNVQALAGYVTSADGEALAFAVLANNFTGPPGPILDVIDSIVDQLASSRRSDSER
jgi:D-alanyl-D-alanine carboxypeptidase/D-alanyl-D-alanine-endopeptidase (penicillin-binding protein 4)